MPAKLAWINETAVHDVTDIVGQGIVRDRRARLKLPSSQDAVSVLILVFCGVLVLYPMGLLVIFSVNVGDPQTFPPDEFGIESGRLGTATARVGGGVESPLPAPAGRGSSYVLS